MKQRRLAFLLTMLMSMMGVEAFAYDAEIGGIYYYFSGTQATVTYLSYNSSSNSQAYTGDVVIPSSVTYNGTTYSVTNISSYAFYKCCGLTSVTIPNSVTNFGEKAFDGCNGLTSVTIGNSVTSIGERAFEGCSGLTSVTIGNSVTSIGVNAFSGCSGLTSVTIPNSVTSISGRAFDGCRSLSSIVIEDGNNTLSFWNQYDDIYFDCPIENLYLGRNISYNSINGDPCSPFERKTKLSTLTLSSFVNKIQVDQFKGCSGLTSVTIPNSVTSIGESAFYNCI